MDLVVIVAGAFIALFAFLFLPAMLELLYPEKDIQQQFESDLNQDPRSEAIELREAVQTGQLTFKKGDPHLKGTLKEKLHLEALEIHIEEKTVCEEPLYCQGNTIAGEKCRIDRLACNGTLEIGPFTRIQEWVDAEGNLDIQHDTQIKNKATCTGTLSIEQNCSFKRLFAFPIQTYHNSAAAIHESDALQHSKGSISQMAFYIGYKIVSIPPGTRIDRDIIAKTDLEIGEGCHIGKNIKANGKLILHSNVVVHGNLFSDHDIEIEAGCMIHGDVFSQKNVIIHQKVTIGTPGKIKSVMGVEGAFLDNDVVIYGYLLTFGKGLIR